MLPSLARLSFAPTSAYQGFKTEESTSGTGKLIQLVIVLDCTNSMARPMAAVKDAILRVVDEMHAKMMESSIASDDLSKKITVEFSLITYRDYGDRPACSQPLKFGGPNAVREAIQMEDASGGEDLPECVELALHYAQTRLQWDDAADKMMLLVTDAPPHAQGGMHDDYPNGAPPQYQCPDIWTTVDRLAARGVCMTVCGCGSFDSYRRTPTIYELMARKTNGRLVRFEGIQSSLASYLGTAALEEDFVQNVLERISGMNLDKDAYDEEVQDAMQGMEAMFRSLSNEEFSVETFFDVADFDDAKDSRQVRAAFQSLSATDDDSVYAEARGYGDSHDEPVYRSLDAGDGEDSPMSPPAKAMRLVPPAPPPLLAHVTTTRDRLRRRP